MAALTRRGALAAGLAVPLAVPAAALARPELDPDATLLVGVVRFKDIAAGAYRQLIAAAPELAPAQRALLARIAEHERSHAEALFADAAFFQATRPKLPSHAVVSGYIPGLAAVRDARGALEVAQRIEDTSIRTLLGALDQLGDAHLIQTVGAVLCCDAQHATAIRDLRGSDPVPVAVESGTR